MTDPTSTTQDTRSLPQLATEINRLHHLIVDEHKTAFERATEIGQMLNRAKHLNGNHGDWLEWLHRSCPDIAETTARLYMRLAGKDKELETAAAANGQRVADLTVRGAAKLLAKPREPKPGSPKPSSGRGGRKPAGKAVSPDLKDLLKNVGPDELGTALALAAWDKEQIQELVKILTSRIKPAPGDLSIPANLQRTPSPPLEPAKELRRSL
jgi:hypothetical protein